LTALPPSAIEAILVHELAHVGRRDYLINLMVSLIEVIFFFNPAVLWLASLIKAERENCCDDIVVAQTSNKTAYIRALVACQEYHLAVPAYAMALRGHKNHLLNRVTRMDY
jgi:beta-lactamase regulating signal transducer with metallopeptidase domain